MNRRTLTALASGCAGLATSALGVGPVSASVHPVTVVHPGHSIQAALDAAPAGATVLLAPGSYAENLLVTKPVTLRGLGRVVLRPSRTIVANLCTNDQDGSPDALPNNTGICVLGTLAAPADGDIPSVVRPVKDVTLDHLRITGFHGQGIIAFGTDRLTVSRVESDHQGDTGLFFEAGTATQISRNNVHDNGHIAIRVADSQGTQIEGNTVWAGEEGIFELDSTGGRISTNTVFGTCLGIGMLDSAAPGPTGHALIAGNTVFENNRYCAAQPGDTPSLSGLGIALLGATRVTVTGNRLVHNVQKSDPVTGQPPMFGGAGLLLLDAGPLAGGNAARGNVIARNVFSHNSPLDVDTGGTHGNAFTHNVCGTASVPGICR